jgi:hypothetical protein
VSLNKAISSRAPLPNNLGESVDNKQFDLTNYHDREEFKSMGWERYRAGGTPGSRAGGVLMIIDAHYHGQVEVLECDPKRRSHTKMAVGRKYYPGYELDIDHYTRHWLHSMGHLIDGDVLFFLQEFMGYYAEKSKYLEKGHTVYHFQKRPLSKKGQKSGE